MISQLIIRNYFELGFSTSLFNNRRVGGGGIRLPMIYVSKDNLLDQQGNEV